MIFINLRADGGGIRGLSTIMILERIMKSFNYGRKGNDIQQPWQVFDLIGGTSTGGFVAGHILVSRLTAEASQNNCHYAWPAQNEFERMRNCIYQLVRADLQTATFQTQFASKSARLLSSKWEVRRGNSGEGH